MLMEFFVPGLVIFFFGLSAATVGVIRMATGAAFSSTWQVMAFSGFSVLYLVLLRRWVKGVFTGARTEADFSAGGDYVGRAGRVVAAIEPPHGGRVMIGDAEWNAIADERLETGSDVKVVRQENLTMVVERF
jgi:membrane protein implicated in regulation of membrane protease activity